jgi:beta-galactosidase
MMRNQWMRPTGLNTGLVNVLAMGLLLLLLPAAAQANTDMFQPIGSAARDIHINGRGFTIHGKPVFIRSGSFHYARVPRALWKNRLLKMKRAGFNTVQTYVFWNFQEPKPGVFDFHGRANLNAFLKLIHSMGMYATVRCGPYDCAEWDDGGYPLWLAFEKGVLVREDDPAFMNPLRQFWNHLLPIVAKNQINHGGAVILVQLENEDPQGWGTVIPNQYFRDLYNMARQHGIDVPMFFSGMHHGFDPAGHKPWNDAQRKSPWYSTEFWSSRTWYHGYGAMSRPQQIQLNRGIWKIIAFGGSGYNFYMLVGSTNFWLWNDNELAACYDYSSAIGQGGDLRPIYYNMKRANYFAGSFADILENSTNVDAKYRDFAKGVSVLARSGPAGTIVFLDNAAHHSVQATLKNGVTLHLAARAIRPVVLHARIGKTWSIIRANSRILGIQHAHNITTVVLYGQPGNRASLLLGTSAMARLGGAMSEQAHFAGDIFGVDATFPSGHQPRLATAQIGKHILRVLIENRRMEKRTWIINSKRRDLIVVGPAYAGALQRSGGKLTLQTDTPLRHSIANAIVYGSAMTPIHLHATGGTAARLPAAPVIHGWQVKGITAAAQVKFSTAGWLSSENPESMGADGILSPWCWYRAWITTPTGGKYQLAFSHVSNLASIFVNGTWAATLAHAGSIPVTLHPGRNIIAVFTAEHGRTKLYNYLGPINKVLAKGIWGQVLLEHAPLRSLPLETWSVKPMSRNYSADVRAIQQGYRAGAGWRSVSTGTDYFHGRRGFAWYHVALPRLAHAAEARLAFTDVDDNGTIFLNGHEVMTHDGFGQAFQVALGKYWHHSGTNELDVLVQNTSGAGGIMGTAGVQIFGPGGFQGVTHWAMRDGAGNHSASTSWKPFTGAAIQPGPPRFFKGYFNWNQHSQVHAVLRVSYTGLSSGHIIVNGHDLGLYPDSTMPTGLYIPSVWLKHGRNTVEILDERGHSPAHVRIVIEQAASRVRATLAQGSVN